MRNKIFVVGARGIPDVEGGAEKNAERLFPLLVQQGWDVSLGGMKGHIKGTLYRGVKLLEAPRSQILKTDKIVYYLTALRMARRLKPDLVHMQGLGSAIFLWAYKLMGAKTVVRYGSADYLLPKWGRIGRLGFLAAEYQLRWADAVIAVTPALVDRLKERGIDGNVHMIPNATDSADSFGGEEYEVPPVPYVLAVGRVTVQKNVHTLIAAFNAFAAGNPDVRLVIAGGVDDEEYLKTFEASLNDKVMLIGRIPRSSLGSLYRGALCYVNSSIHEGHSNAILEAISFGAPILLSDIPENRDFKIDAKHFFDPTDPGSIVDALRRVERDRPGYVVDGSQFASWQTVADDTSAVYRRIGLAPATAP